MSQLWVVPADELRAVTPDAQAKTHFLLVDCVGVTEKTLADTKPLDENPSVPCFSRGWLELEGIRPVRFPWYRSASNELRVRTSKPPSAPQGFVPSDCGL